MKQLNLTKKELKNIGFKEYKGKGDETNTARTYFKIETINGYFYYNPEEIEYKWYHKTIIGDIANSVHLDIRNTIELYVTLQCFKVKFNLIF